MRIAGTFDGFSYLESVDGSRDNVDILGNVIHGALVIMDGTAEPRRAEAVIDEIFSGSNVLFELIQLLL